MSAFVKISKVEKWGEWDRKRQSSKADEYHKAAELSGSTPLAGYYYFNEGLIHVQRTGDLDLAIFALEKAEQLKAWDTGNIIQGASDFFLGFAYKKTGLNEEAAAALQRVLDCDLCSYYHEDAATVLSQINGQ